MPESQETQQFVGRCLAQLNMRDELMTKSGQLSPAKLSKIIVQNGLTPFTGKGCSVLNLWLLTLARGCRNIQKGRICDTALPTMLQQKATVIGIGGFSKVYKFSVGQKNYALKIIRGKGTGTGGEKTSSIRAQLREAHLLLDINEKCKHPSILQLYDFWSQPDSSMALLTEFAGRPLRTLTTGWLRLHPTTFLDVAQQLLAAVEALHLAQFLHRDLKPANVTYQLLPPKLEIKVIDFGCACPFDSNLLSRSCGTPSYLAPWTCFESRRSLVQLIAADTWSALMTLMALLNEGQSPVQAKIEKIGNFPDWSLLIQKKTDEQILQRLELTPPVFPVPQVSKWLVEKLSLFEKQAPVTSLRRDVLEFVPAAKQCDPVAWFSSLVGEPSTELLSSTLTTTVKDETTGDA